MKRFCKILGTILSIVGFVGLFATSDTIGLQVIVTGCALVSLYTGYRLLDRSGALKETL